jgi:CubicO group peptidase (beta-lactamase class C family)
MKSPFDRMHRVLSDHIDRKELPGLVSLVSHRGGVHVETLGTLSFDSPEPMKRDTIFRIASITKPITAVAAMMLVEDCKLRLDDSIEPWLPELASRRVLKSLSSELDDTVPANRAITFRDLLTYRMGFGSVMAKAGTYPIQKWIREYRIGGDGPMLPSDAPGMDEWLRRLGSLPLLAQPGERWMYHVSGDVLGALITRVSGKSLGTFMRERIFDPLGMKDTAFHVPPEKIGRLPACYFFNRETNKLDFFDDPVNSAWRVAPPGESGGGGLVSTIDDYLAFSRMMLERPARPRADSFARQRRIDDVRSPHPGATRGSRNLLWNTFRLGIGNGGRHPPRGDLSHTRPFRLDRRLRHNRIHRSRRKQNRHPFYATHDGFSGCAKNLHRFLDTCLRGDGIDPVLLFGPTLHHLFRALPFAIGA